MRVRNEAISRLNSIEIINPYEPWPRFASLGVRARGIDAKHCTCCFSARKTVEAFGGRMHQFFFAFGEFDGISIVEFPDNESCAACAVMLSGAGANTTLQTTVLLTPSEGQAAMQRASSVQHGYRSPLRYPLPWA